MSARRTGARSIGSGMQITAVAALPDDRFWPGENGVCFDIFQKFTVTSFVVTFGNADRIKDIGDGGIALLPGDFGKSGIKAVPFIVFTVGSGGEVGGGSADDPGGKFGIDGQHSAFKEFEKSFGVFFFLIGGFRKDGGNLHKTLFPGARSKIGVTVSGLGFTGKTLQKISFGTTATK